MKNLRTVMAIKRISTAALAAVIGVTEKTANNKLNGETEFTLYEALTIKRELFPEYDLVYLFERDEEAA